MGIAFSVQAPEVEELETGPPEKLAVENASRKASAVAAAVPGSPVLGADTVVSLDGRVYGKSADRAQARANLSALSGRRHEVIGGLCLIERRETHLAAERTVVEFRDLDGALLEWYLDTGEWRDRAGAYAIQGRGAALVSAIQGDYLNVVGLPVARLVELAPWLLGGRPASEAVV